MSGTDLTLDRGPAQGTPLRDRLGGPAWGARAERWAWRLAVANLVANVGIVVTGGAVRLTGSGLGCPTWPRCTEDSYVPHGELGMHGAIEFGNRLLTWVLVLVAVGSFLSVWRAGRRRATRLATVVALGIPAQAVLGGITVLTELNPWIVALHFLLSMALIAVCVLLLEELRGPARPAASRPTSRLAVGVLASGWVVLYLGTVVTGSGPHSGDVDSRRTGLDPQVMSHVHAWAVYAMVGLTVALIWVARRQGDAAVLRPAWVLLWLELSQGVVGFVQYFLDLPVLLVGLHMLGAGLISAAMAWLVVATLPRAVAGDAGRRESVGSGAGTGTPGSPVPA